MRIFEKFPTTHICPICKTNENKPCTLIDVEEIREGFEVTSIPVHLDCLDLIIGDIGGNRRMIQHSCPITE